MDQLSWLFYLAAALFGLVLGSFFNVAIYRLPLGETLGDRSKCPNCSAAINWYDNVPLLSYVILRGRCRSCKERISIRYPAVELLTALLFVLMYWWSVTLVPKDLKVAGGNFVPEVFIGLLLVSVLIISSGTDVTDGIVPNRVTYPGLVAMLLLVTGLALYRGQPGRIGLAAAAAAIGGGFLLAAGLLYGALFMRRRDAAEGAKPVAPDGSPGIGDEAESPLGPAHTPGDSDGSGDEASRGIPTGIGMGDVKLAAFFGLALGYFHWYLIIVGLFLGFLVGALGSIFFVIAAKKGRKDRLPFAPFLSAGAIIALVWGKSLVDAYLKLLR